MKIHIDHQSDDICIYGSINGLTIGVAHGEIYWEHDCNLRNGKMYRHIKKMSLISIYVHPEYRNCGYGSKLLKRLIKYSKGIGIRSIYLDDMSDGYRGTHNIYRKMGFKYINDDGPEMMLII